jgi:peptidoglycan hydrolase-like protein with peptidoglycan-binding domain
MKHSQYIVVGILFALTMSPALASAQSYSDTESYYDGSTESRSERRERMRQYRQQSSDLQQKINALPSTASPSVFIPVLLGVGLKNIWPNFGDPRSGGRLHEGEDIMAVKGDPIISPTAAVVLRAGDNGGSEGIYVYTANPGGETFVYYHLDRIGEGVVPGLVLAQGSLIGYVGNTGNASGGAAHLHFELHDSSGNPTDPFPRLTAEFSLQQKMDYLTTIFTQTADTRAMAQFLVTNFRSTFNSAVNAGIVVPAPINFALLSTPAGTAPTSGNLLPAGDLELGSSGVAVIALQKYLIQANATASAVRLAAAGATGYFGAITKAALLEFQALNNISPANGYYGATTRTYIAAHPLGTSIPPTPTPPISSDTTVLTRDLYIGISGEDVRTLQKILNSKGFIVAATGVGSPGNETTYFGTATQAAVIRFQIARGISPAVGRVGPATRAALGSL